MQDDEDIYIDCECWSCKAYMYLCDIIDHLFSRSSMPQVHDKQDNSIHE
jgi:hypothetical protein